MTVASQTNLDDENPRHSKVSTSDDMSDVTPPTRGNGGIFDQAMVEKVIKFRFTASTTAGKHQADPRIIHSHWIQTVQEALGHEIEIVNNRSEKIAKIDALQWSSNPLLHQRQFKVYQKTTGRHPNRKTTYFILHRILTTETIKNIKSIPEVQKILRTNQCYMSEHLWSEKEWDTTTIGFVTNLDPGFYDRHQAQTKFHSILLKKASDVSNRRLKIRIPAFKMTFATPTTILKDHRFSTKAYAIEVKRDDQVPMMQTLKSLMQDTSIFVPFAMRYKYNEGFAQAIKFQTHQLSENMTIVLQNINESSMYYVENHIRSIEGVQDIVAANDNIHSGRFNILVNKAYFTSARSKIQQNLDAWYEEYVPSDALPRPDYFPGPPRVRPIAYDGNSSGENSWMSKSNASFLSMDLSSVENDDYFSSTPMVDRMFSYKSVLISSSTERGRKVINNIENETTNEDDAREIISDITTARTEMDSNQITEIETLKRRQQEEISEARAIIKSQEREIQQLKAAQRQAAEAYDKATVDIRIQQERFATMLSDQITKAEKKRNIEMEQMRKDMMDLMKQMLQRTQDNDLLTQQFAVVHATSSKRPPEISSTTDDNYSENTSYCRKEKRIDNRTTPTKKLFYDEEHINVNTEAPIPSPHGDDASSISE